LKNNNIPYLGDIQVNNKLFTFMPLTNLLLEEKEYGIK